MKGWGHYGVYLSFEIQQALICSIELDDQKSELDLCHREYLLTRQGCHVFP